MRQFGLLVFCLCTALVASARGQPLTDNEIVVTGQRLREQVETYVDALTSTPPGSGQLPRWDRSICPQIASRVIRESDAQAVIDRLALRAREVGLETSPPGCRANILIFVTHHVAELTSDIARDYRSFVRNAPGGIRPPSRAEFSAFSLGDRPINWMYIAAYMSPDGRFFENGAHTGIGVTPTRLRPHARQDFAQVVVVMDADVIQGVSAHSVGDYLAMISLARIDAEQARTPSADTILNLFSDSTSKPVEMSEWDRAYLRGTYLVTRDARDSVSQGRHIGHYMLRQLTAQGESEPPR